MKYILRIAAVLVALGNWCALMTGGDLSRLASYDWAEWLTFFLLPTVLGLASAEVALRHAAKALRGGFLDRYAAMAATVWMGGCSAAWRSPRAESSATRRWALAVRSLTPSCAAIRYSTVPFISGLLRVTSGSMDNDASRGIGRRTVLLLGL